MHYFLLPDGNSIARIPRSFTRSMAKAVTLLYPERMDDVNTLFPVEGRFADDAVWFSLAPQSESPQGEIHAILRDVVQRHVSTCAMFNMTIEQGLECDDFHFDSQSSYLSGAKIYVAPRDEAEFCKNTGLVFPLPVIGRGTKTLNVTAEQKAKIEDRYKDDILLIKSILGEKA